MDVGTWLEELGLAAYADAFRKNGVDGELLPELTNDDLKDLGVERLADRKRLLKAAARLHSLEPGDDAPAPVPVSAPAIVEGDRRPVTVLFADIVGFSTLSNELGAEATHELLNRYFQSVDAAVESYGGKIDKHIGDSVMAVFGAPIAHDDDPMRAVRTAMEIHNRLAALSADGGRPLQAHIGLASGQVIASGTGSDAYNEYTVTGESVNLASRLQDKAGPGETLVSDELHGIIADRVEGEALGKIEVKGFTEPVRAWRIDAFADRKRRGKASEFVGRRSEMTHFASAVRVCLEERTGQTVIIRGEAGIGKTRLAEEFTQIATDNGFAVHRGLVLNFGVSKGQDAVRAITRTLLRLSAESGEEDCRAAAESAVSDGVLAPEQRVFVYDLLDLPQRPETRSIYEAMDNNSRIEGKSDVIANLIQTANGDNPLLLLVEDVHWASATLLSFLARMAATVADCPALLILTTRIDEDPLNRTWRGLTGGCPITTFDLGPLRPEEALAFAGSVFETAQDFALDCVRRAEGNPLFLEQLLRTAAEMDGREIPATVQSLVLARMDRLPVGDKKAVQAASVLGQRFDLQPLRHLIGEPAYQCAGLLERSLVRQEGNGFLFAHALVHEGIYASLLASRRRQLHRAAADWYRGRDLVLAAEHLDRAEDPKAAAAYLAAALAQHDALHFESVLRLTERGIALADDPPVRCDLICARANALRDIGATEGSVDAFGEALSAAPDDFRRCRALIGTARGLRIMDRQEEALDSLREAQEIAERAELTAELATIHYLRGNVYFPLGRIDGCLAEHEKALVLARRVGSTEAEAQALSGLGDAYYLRGLMRTSCEQFRACVNLCREHGYGRIEVANSNMIGWTRIHLFEFREALKDAQQSASMAAEVRHHRAELLGLMLAGRVRAQLGKLEKGLGDLERGLELARKIGAGNFEVQVLVVTGQILNLQGKSGEARACLDRAVDLVRETGMRFIGPAALATRALMLEDREEAEAALREAERILDAGCVSHNHIWFADPAIERALADANWDEAERQAGRLETYTREEPLDWPDFLAARARALAAWGRGNRDRQVLEEIKRLRELALEKGTLASDRRLAESLTEA